MMVLISVARPDEAVEALSGGADIIDVKDPSRGSLGAPPAKLFELIVRVIRNTSHKPTSTSVALGDDPRDASLKLLSIVKEQAVDYIKVGNLGLNSLNEAIKTYRDLRLRAEKMHLVAVAYADFSLIRSLKPVEVLKAAYKSDYDVFMIDTFVKNGRSTFDYLQVNEVLEFKKLTHDRGMLFALAGSLKLEHAKVVCEVEPDIAGFRSAACSGGRVEGTVVRNKVEQLVKVYKRLTEVNETVS